jgi:hypothetical protein
MPKFIDRLLDDLADRIADRLLAAITPPQSTSASTYATSILGDDRFTDAERALLIQRARQDG